MLASKTHRSVHNSSFLHPQGLHHLGHIHHFLCRAPLNGGGYGIEHATEADCVTTGEIQPHSYKISLIFAQAYTHTVLHAHVAHTTAHLTPHSPTHIHTCPHSTHPHTHSHTCPHPHPHAYSYPHTRQISPTLHHSWVVAGIPLDFAHVLNHISRGLQVGAAAISGPVGDGTGSPPVPYQTAREDRSSITRCVSSHPLGLTLASWTLTVCSTKPCSLFPPCLVGSVHCGSCSDVCELQHTLPRLH